MAPDPAVAAQVWYGITKDPQVRTLMAGLPILTRQKVADAFEDLQFNPRPPESMRMPYPTEKPILRKPILIDNETQRKYNLVYLIDDEKEKVVVISLEMFVQ